jgi:hypothetical protein
MPTTTSSAGEIAGMRFPGQLKGIRGDAVHVA